MVQVEVLLILVLIASAMTVPVTVDEAAFVLDTNGDAAKDVEIPPLPWEYSTNETCLPFLESIKQAVVKSGYAKKKCTSDGRWKGNGDSTNWPDYGWTDYDECFSDYANDLMAKAAEVTELVEKFSTIAKDNTEH